MRQKCLRVVVKPGGVAGDDDVVRLLRHVILTRVHQTVHLGFTLLLIVLSHTHTLAVHAADNSNNVYHCTTTSHTHDKIPYLPCRADRGVFLFIWESETDLFFIIIKCLLLHTHNVTWRRFLFLITQSCWFMYRSLQTGGALTQISHGPSFNRSVLAVLLLINCIRIKNIRV